MYPKYAVGIYVDKKMTIKFMKVTKNDPYVKKTIEVEYENGIIRPKALSKASWW